MHSNTPWVVIPSRYNGQLRNLICDAERRMVGDIQSDQDAQRVVASVNACASVSAGALDTAQAKGWLAAVSAAEARAAEAEQRCRTLQLERDEATRRAIAAERQLNETAGAGETWRLKDAASAREMAVTMASPVCHS